MRGILLVIFAASLTGCAAGKSYQRECEEQTATFPAMVRCLKTALDADRRPYSEETKLYVMKAEQLSQKVQRQEMSDADARVALQELRVQLKANGAVTAPTRTRCRRVQNVLYCRSY
jgi:hypothetical protein